MSRSAAPLRLVPVDERTSFLDDVYRRYCRYVAAVVLRLDGRHAEVDDIVQEVFVEAARGVARLRDADAVKGWLATITVRVAMRRLRWRRVRGWLRVDGDHDYDDLPDPSLSGEERAAVAGIYRLLDRFPAAQRSAWLLHHGEGMSADRVAVLCGCSLATAKRWIANVSDKIRRAITHG